jgi:hypothetical protein
MFPRLLVTVSWPASAFRRSARNLKPRQATPVPDYILYDAFFYRVKWLSDLADKYSSRGKAASADYFRSMLQKKAGLTAQEDAALKAIAADWRAGDLGIVHAGRALVKAGAAANDRPAAGSCRASASSWWPATSASSRPPWDRRVFSNWTASCASPPP